MTKRKSKKVGATCSTMTDNSRKYNYIYDKIVQEPGDITGLVAYSLYKKQKVEYVSGLKEQYGRDPSDVELATFHTVSCQQIKNYRQDADLKIKAVYEETSRAYRANMRKIYDEELKERLKGTLKGGILASVLGSFVTALIIVMMSFILIGYRLGIEGVYHVAAGHVVLQVQQASPALNADLNYAAKENATPK